MIGSALLIADVNAGDDRPAVLAREGVALDGGRFRWGAAELCGGGGTGIAGSDGAREEGERQQYATTRGAMTDFRHDVLLLKGARYLSSPSDSPRHGW